MKQLVKRLSFGKRRRRFDRPKDYPTDFDPAVVETIIRVRPFTLTSPERISALCETVKYVTTNAISGDFVECGVWRGGSMMAAAITLQQLGHQDRDLHLFDTFEGMPPPSEHDVALDGSRASEMLANQNREDPSSVWCVSGLDEVKANLQTTGYPQHRIHYVPGKVEETVPAEAPEQIAILRLDTDWYESTRHEMEQLYPRLVPGGVLIIDDYGHWDGARRAVDEYIRAQRVPILLNRIDYTGRIGIAR